MEKKKKKGRRRRRRRRRRKRKKKKPNLRYGTMTMSMESNIEQGLLGFLVWIHVYGLWVVRNLTLE